MRKLFLTFSLILATLIFCGGTSFAFPRCEDSPLDAEESSHSYSPGNWNNCVGTYTDDNMDEYAGEWKNGKPHGQGIYTYSWGSKYVGELRNGKKYGQGTYTFPHGNIYVGKFKNGLFHGQGTTYFPDGTVFQGGLWKNGKFQYAQKGTPPSTAKKASGSLCEDSPTDDFYIAREWDGCEGTYTVANGKGKGNKYVGEWKGGKYHGQGTYTVGNLGDQGNFSGDKYIGEWKNGKYHGQGTYTFANGDKYVGEHKDGKYHGQGTFTFGPPSKWAGSKYFGEWKNNLYHGKGTLTYTDGRVKEGVWENNKFQYAQKVTPTVTVLKTPPRKPVIRAAPARDTTPPEISIASRIQVREDSPTIRGRVSDENRIVQVNVNDVAADLSGNNFSFSRYVPLSGTQVTIEAVDEWGNRATKVVRLTREEVRAAVKRFDQLDPTNFSVRPKPHAVALIIGIAQYKRTVKAEYADKDAMFFKDYARRKLGVPLKNIKVITNTEAGLIDILEAASEWLPQATRAHKSDIYVFFAGHGLSSEDGEDVYLLPYNGSPKLLEKTSLVRSDLFRTIAKARPRSVTVFLDTCYSGTTRSKDIIVARRGITIKPREQAIPGGFTVFSAASLTQTAEMLKEVGHGLFSYYLMKGMEGAADRNGNREITSGELHRYVHANVSRLRGNQTPQMRGNPNRVLVRW